MLEKIKYLLDEAEKFSAKTQDELEQFRIKLLSKKGQIGQLFDEFKQLPSEQKREVGQLLNDLKNKAQEKFDHWKLLLDSSSESQQDSSLDLSLTGDSMPLGSRHPISVMLNEIISIFSRLGFTIAEGPEIEDDWHNFSALNFPQNHPARDMQDTFFVSQDPVTLLRTHTSSVQVRTMENQQPPIRIIAPGRVFRNEAISARSHCAFHQIEGFYIDKNVSFADLKQTLLYFAKEFYGEDTKIRLRPSYFPFTEPSAEMDISCTCNGKGCNLCKYTGWLEILGCGMVHPNVLDSSGIDSKKYSGFAFGMGIERAVMLKYGIKDIRMYFENDVRFLRQFAAAV